MPRAALPKLLNVWLPPDSGLLHIRSQNYDGAKISNISEIAIISAYFFAKYCSTTRNEL